MTRFDFSLMMMAVIASGCSTPGTAMESPQAPTPSSLETCSEALQRAVLSAESGDIDSMRYLVLYFTLEDTNEVQAYRWMFAAAEAGDKSMQDAVLAELGKNDDTVSRGLVAHLTHRWLSLKATQDGN